MSITKNIFEQLLYEEESSTLDFKRDQYPFDQVSNDDKSELLKDILAFTNAWRRSDAYILVGVDEVRGGRSKIVGVSNQLDDAKLQQFVNSKTNRPVQFSYYQLEYEQKDIGIIHIPPQERPVYLTRDFGKLEKEEVYIRRGTSTAIAKPDEIAKMGAAARETATAFPLLEAQFFDIDNLNELGQSTEIKTVNLVLPPSSEIPDYGVSRSFSLDLMDISKNKNYYRDSARYLQANQMFERVNFCVKNAGSVVANDVRIRAEIEDPQSILMLADAHHMPEEPSWYGVIYRPTISRDPIPLDVIVQRTPRSSYIYANLGKIQPKGRAHTVDGLFIGARESTTLTLRIAVSADNLPAPRAQELRVKIVSQERKIDVDELLDSAKEWASDTTIDDHED